MKTESSECSGVWRNGKEKKEERRIKKKRERVRVWRRKNERKKRKKKCRVWRIKKEGEKKKNEILSLFFHNKF